MNQKSFCLTAGILARKSCTAPVLINSHPGCFHPVGRGRDGMGRDGTEDQLWSETGSVVGLIPKAKIDNEELFLCPGLALDAL